MATSPTSGPGGSNGLTGNSLVVQGTPTQTAPLADIRSDDGRPGLDIESDGTGGIASVDIFAGSGSISFGAGAMTLSGPFTLALAAFHLLFGPTTEPDATDLSPSQFALWLDDTPAATKLMVKAKDSGGTVRSAAIALS